VRIVIIGAGGLATTTARMLIDAGCEVVVIERDGERVAALRAELDCGLIHGDGTRPAILKEADPSRATALLCLSGSDRDNLLASVVGRHLGFPRIITKTEEADFESISIELGLGETIVPDRTIARSLVDMLHGRSVPELLASLDSDVRLFAFVIEEPIPRSELDLPKKSRLIGISRNGRFRFPGEDADERLEAGDEVLLLADARNVDRLEKRWRRRPES
jgi:trk system potassium uptake protein TrkA